MPGVTGYKTLMGIGYKYISRKVLMLIGTEEDGSTVPGDPSLFHYPDSFSNIYFTLFLLLKRLKDISIHVRSYNTTKISMNTTYHQIKIG